MYRLLENESVVCIDVDNTLVIRNKEDHIDNDDKTSFMDPYDGQMLYLQVHEPHVKLLKDYKARGFSVIVWSGAGYRWAETVVNRLELENFVDIVQSKPFRYVDDMDASTILGLRIYLKPDGSEQNSSVNKEVW